MFSVDWFFWRNGILWDKRRAASLLGKVDNQAQFTYSLIACNHNCTSTQCYKTIHRCEIIHICRVNIMISTIHDIVPRSTLSGGKYRHAFDIHLQTIDDMVIIRDVISIWFRGAAEKFLDIIMRQLPLVSWYNQRTTVVITICYYR